MLKLLLLSQRPIIARKYKLAFHFSFFIFSFSFCLLFSSCNTFDPPIIVPVYGHIDSIHFTVPTDSLTTEGSASAQIPYAWVYLDDASVGAYQMPCTFPIIASNGIHNIKIYPAIIPAAGGSPAMIYPFYQFYSVNVNLQQGSVYKFQPTSLYFTWVKFPLIESFDAESPGAPPAHIINYRGLDKIGASEDTMKITYKKSLVYSGKGSGIAVVNQAHPYYIGITDPPFDSIPSLSSALFLEANYRATGVFTIGLVEGDTTNLIQLGLAIYPTTGWNKIYIDLAPTVVAYPIRPYRVFFTMTLQSGDVSDTLLLDNVKLLD